MSTGKNAHPESGTQVGSDVDRIPHPLSKDRALSSRASGHLCTFLPGPFELSGSLFEETDRTGGKEMNWEAVAASCGSQIWKVAAER